MCPARSCGHLGPEPDRNQCSLETRLAGGGLGRIPCSGGNPRVDHSHRVPQQAGPPSWGLRMSISSQSTRKQDHERLLWLQPSPSPQEPLLYSPPRCQQRRTGIRAAQWEYAQGPAHAPPSLSGDSHSSCKAPQMWGLRQLTLFSVALSSTLTPAAGRATLS